MILLAICFLFVLMITAGEEVTYNIFFAITLCIFFFLSAFIFMAHDFKLNNPKKITKFEENIYSLKDGDSKISGGFTIGSGYINSEPQYAYFVINKDGSKEKKYVESTGAKIYEDNSVEPHVEITKCFDGKHYSFLAGFFIYDEDGICESQKTVKLFVPQNTVILDFNVN